MRRISGASGVGAAVARADRQVMSYGNHMVPEAPGDLSGAGRTRGRCAGEEQEPPETAGGRTKKSTGEPGQKYPKGHWGATVTRMTSFHPKESSQFAATKAAVLRGELSRALLINSFAPFSPRRGRHLRRAQRCATLAS
jgi:hypothetical protein